MAFVLVLFREARKNLDSFYPIERRKIEVALENIITDPYSGKKLAGVMRDIYSMRAWPYRIIYTISKESGIIIVVRISHRKEVYRKIDK